MKKRNKIIYWIATIWLASGLLAGGLQQIFLTPNFVTIFTHLGYPMYLMYILGVWKVLATVAILVPRFKLLKEWAYAGSFFVWSGALVSHLALGDYTFMALFPSICLLGLTIISWYFRPENRKMTLSISIK